MASSRLSFSQYRLEAEIDRYRAECQWDKIPSIVEQLVAARFHEDDDYGTLLLAEALLEESLQDNLSLLRNATPLTDINQPKLSRSKGYLNSILSRGRLGPRHLNEALLLMAKIHYVQGDYRDAQGMCARVGIDELTGDEQPIYHLRLLAEAFVIKGLSLDHQAVSAASRLRLSEREEECLSCYLRACDTALVYLQELDKTVVTLSSKAAKTSLAPPPLDIDLGFFQQAALQSAYLCLLHRGHLAQGAQQLRRVLRVVESRGSQSFRKLAEVLLSSVSEDSYWAPMSLPPSAWLQREGNAGPKDAMYPSSKPPQCYRTDSVFCPQDVVEEAVLLLLITESMASGDAVISRAPDHKEVRETSLQDATSVYDLLSIGMARRGQYAMLSELEEAEALSQSVVSMGEEAAEFLPRAYLTVGLCCSLQASDAYALDPNDAKIALYLSLQLALVRQVAAAMDPLQVALSLHGDDLHSLHLLTLLLSAQKHHQHALETLTLALSQHPESFNLLFTKVKLEEALYGPGVALQTCEDMLHLWQRRYDFTRTSEGDDSSSIHPPEPLPLSRKPSRLHLNLPDFQDTETGSQSGPSLAASRLEQAMSEVSAISSAHKQGPAYIWTTLERIWLQAGELFMAEGRLKEAQFCVQEAAVLFPNSHSVLLLRGRLAELKGNQDEAKSFYDEALAIHPNGHRILLHLVRESERDTHGHTHIHTQVW
ncbi:unnamed protein product [Coregonus sp. 'balchen']|nr:unnamed protein product [Coregonus sp. 'balchen']